MFGKHKIISKIAVTEQFSLLKNAPDQGMCAVKRYEFTTGSGKRVK